MNPVSRLHETQGTPKSLLNPGRFTTLTNHPPISSPMSGHPTRSPATARSCSTLGSSPQIRVGPICGVESCKMCRWAATQYFPTTRLLRFVHGVRIVHGVCRFGRRAYVSKIQRNRCLESLSQQGFRRIATLFIQTVATRSLPVSCVLSIRCGSPAVEPATVAVLGRPHHFDLLHDAAVVDQVLGHPGRSR